MAVYKRSYRGYAGSVTSEWSRFAIIPRYAYRGLFRSKIMTAFFVICFIPPLVFLFLIYLANNIGSFARVFGVTGATSPFAVDGEFFATYLGIQAALSFVLTAFVGPGLISGDLANRALPLYLSRPFTRAEYVIGKMSVLLILLSLITWVPGLLLFLFQSYLEGWGWFAQNIRIAGAIFLGSWIWILLLALLSLAISSWVKWRMAASAALIGVFFIPSAFAEVINNIFYTRWGDLISLRALIGAAWAGLFGTFVRQAGRIRSFNPRRTLFVDLFQPPLWSAWLMLFAICAVCLLLLYRKVRAYEVVN